VGLEAFASLTSHTATEADVNLSGLHAARSKEHNRAAAGNSQAITKLRRKSFSTLSESDVMLFRAFAAPPAAALATPTAEAAMVADNRRAAEAAASPSTYTEPSRRVEEGLGGTAVAPQGQAAPHWCVAQGERRRGRFEGGTLGLAFGVAVALAVCVCFISQADLRGSRHFVLEGRSSGGELEDERALSAAITMAVKTKQTDLLTFPAEFNATLSDVAPYVDETDTASEEGVAEKEINAEYAAGTDPW